jgi:hypothetical protein
MLKLFKRKNKNQLNENEMEVLSLILAGENPVLEGLRKQLTSDFIMGVNRMNDGPKSVAGVLVQNERARYQLQFHLPYDRTKNYSINENLTFHIDDLVVTNKADGRDIFFDLLIYEGEIANLLGVVTQGEFPLDFEIGEWNYIGIDRKRSKSRDMSKIPSVEEAEPPLLLTEFQKWLVSLKNEVLIGMGEEELRFIENPAANLKTIAAFEKEHELTLPRDFCEFLGITNGCSFFGHSILALKDCYIFDDPQFSQFMPFHTWVDGNFTAFNLDDRFSVYYISHDPLGFAKVASSFEDWIRAVENEIRNNGQLYHPADRKKDSVFGNALNVMKKV